MNLLIFTQQELHNDGTLRLRDYRHEHLCGVCRAAVGKEFRVGMLNGAVGTGRVVSTDQTETVLEIRLEELTESAAAPLVDIVLALPRPQMLKRILENAATFGVRKIALVRTVRVERSYFSTPVLEPDSVEKHLRLGLEQSMTTFLPQVSVFEHFGDFLREALPGFYSGRRLLAEQSAPRSLAQIEIGARSEVTVAIGPEGGFVPSELRTFEELGFVGFALGPRVLRVETALYAVLAQLNLLRERNEKN